MTTRTIDFVFKTGKTDYINVSDLSAPYDFVTTCQVGSGVGSVSYEILASDNLIDWKSLGIESKSLTIVSLVNTRRIDKKYSYVALDVKSISGADAKISLSIKPLNIDSIISEYELALTDGEYIGDLKRISDGDNRGAVIRWDYPEGSETPAWCWWLWPQSRYE